MTSKLSKTVAAIVLAAIIGVFLFSALHFNCRDTSGLSEDSCAYVLLGRSLAEGQGYRSLWIDGAPFHVKFPPVLPAMLATLQVLGGGLCLAFYGMVVLAGAALFFIYRLLRPAERGLALTVVLLVASNGLFYKYSRMIAAEMPFFVFSLAALWLGSRVIRREKSSVCLETCFVLFVALAFLTRVIGLALVPAWIIALFYNERLKGKKEPPQSVWRFLTAVMFPVGLWGAWLCIFTTHMTENYWGGFLAVADPFHYGAGALSLADIFIRTAKGFYAIIFYAIPRALLNTGFGSRNVLALAASGLFFLGWFKRWKKERSYLESYTAVYLVLVALAPAAAKVSDRFIVPILPLLFYYFLEGLRAPFEMIKGNGQLLRWLFVALFGMFLTGYFFHAPLASRIRLPGEVGQVARNDVYSWVKANTPRDAVFISAKQTAFYFYTGRRMARYSATAYDQKELDILLREGRAGYVFCDEDDPVSVHMCGPLILQEQGLLKIVYDQGGKKVFRVGKGKTE